MSWISSGLLSQIKGRQKKEERKTQRASWEHLAGAARVSPRLPHQPNARPSPSFALLCLTEKDKIAEEQMGDKNKRDRATRERESNTRREGAGEGQKRVRKPPNLVESGGSVEHKTIQQRQEGREREDREAEDKGERAQLRYEGETRGT